MSASVTLYDAHAHFFTDDLQRYPIDPSGAREGADNLRHRILSDPMRPDVLLPSWSANGITGGAAVQYSSAYKTDNDYILDCADQHPDRISAVIILSATDGTTPGRLTELVNRRRVSGLRLTGWPDGDGRHAWVGSTAARRTLETVEQLGIALVLMYFPTRQSVDALGQIADVVQSFPMMPVVLDHIGWPLSEGAPDFGMSAVADTLGRFDNAFFKVTSVNLTELDQVGIDTTGFMRRAVDMFGASRLIWGSDQGNTPGTLADKVEMILAATASLTPAERQAVLHDNGRALFHR